MGCHVTKKSINRARQRLVAFVSWAISPGIGKSSHFQAHAVFPKFGLNRLYGTHQWSPAMVCVCPRYSFFWKLSKFIIFLPSMQVTVEMTSVTNSSKHVHTGKDAADSNIARATRMAANSRSWWMLPSISGIYTGVFSLGRRMTVDSNTNYIYFF